MDPTVVPGVVVGKFFMPYFQLKNVAITYKMICLQLKCEKINIEKKKPVFYGLMDKEYEENKEYHSTAHTEPKSGLGSMGAIP